MIILYGSYAFSLIAILSDLACALIPYFIVKDLEMPYRTKVTITIILGVGILASIAAIARIPYFHYYTMTDNILCKFKHSGARSLSLELSSPQMIVSS